MPGRHLVLRPAAKDDAEGVARVHLSARRAAPMPAPVHDAAAVARWLASRINGPAGDEMWVAERAGVIAGYARFTRTWLDDLYVAPDQARTGVGSALLDLVKARLPGGFGLWVFEVNEPARTFYRNRGMVEVERTDGTANEEQEPDIRMVWPGPLA